MSVDLYSGRVLELAAEIPYIGALGRPHGRSHKVSRLCGSEVTVDVIMDGQIVKDFAIEPKACALGQASSSILSRNIIGVSRDDVAEARDAFRAMLKCGGPPPNGIFWELRYLEAVADYPPRHTSALLAFDAAVEAIDLAIAANLQGATPTGLALT